MMGCGTVNSNYSPFNSGAAESLATSGGKFSRYTGSVGSIAQYQKFFKKVFTPAQP